jgi:hypothetical protein
LDHSDLLLLFRESPAWRLLRADTAPLILSVLHKAFKRDHSPTIMESRLRSILEAELEALRGDHDTVAKTAREYLLDWTDRDHGYLRRYQPSDTDEPVCELTPDAERVFQWLDQLQPKTHVGTESKFKRLAAMLAEIIENSTADPTARIARLRAEQAELQRQIDEIQRTGVAPTFNPTQVNERFAAVLGTARELLGDFREVERHFRRVTESLVARQSQSGATRGEIVGHTLDAQDQLLQSSQGQSFYAFWEFLLDPERRSQFADLVEQSYALPMMAADLRADGLLWRLQSSLRTEGEKVVASNERLVAQMRRVLDSRASLDRREVGRLIHDIKTLAHATRNSPPTDELGNVDFGPLISSLLSKAQWSPQVTVRFGEDLQESDGGDLGDAFEAFLRKHPIDFARLRNNIRECLRSRIQISLPELLELYPPRNGIFEVLAYVVIADSDGPHVVLDAWDFITWPGETHRRFRVPQTVFSNA